MTPFFRTISIPTLHIMPKRALSSTTHLRSPPAKRPRTNAEVVHRKIATAEAAAKVDANPPLSQLNALIAQGFKPTQKGDAVVYWMRMEDMRSTQYFRLR